MTLESSSAEVVAPSIDDMKSEAERNDQPLVTDDAGGETVTESAEEATKVDETTVTNQTKAEDTIDAAIPMPAGPVISTGSGKGVMNELLTSDLVVTKSDSVVTKSMSGFQELEQWPSGEIPLAELHLQPPILDVASSSLNKLTSNKEQDGTFVQESLPSVPVEPDTAMTISDKGSEKVDVLATDALAEEPIEEPLEIQEPATTSEDQETAIETVMQMDELLPPKESGLGEKIDVLATEESATEDHGVTEEILQENIVPEETSDDIVISLLEVPLLNENGNEVIVESTEKEKETVEEVFDDSEQQMEPSVATESRNRENSNAEKPFGTPDAPSDLYEHVGDVDVTDESTKQEEAIVALLGESTIADVQTDSNVKKQENDTPIKANNQEMILASNREGEIAIVELKDDSNISTQETKTPMRANDQKEELVSVEKDELATIELQEDSNVDLPETEMPTKANEQAEILVSSEKGEIASVELQEELPTKADEQAEIFASSEKGEKATVELQLDSNVDVPGTEMPTKAGEQAEIFVSSEKGEKATIELQQEDSKAIEQESEAPVIADNPEEEGDEAGAHNLTAKGEEVVDQTIKSSENIIANQANQNYAGIAIDPEASPIQENDASNILREKVTHDSIDERGIKERVDSIPINEEPIISPPETEAANQTPKASPRDPPMEEPRLYTDSAEKAAASSVSRSIDPPETAQRELEDLETGSSTAHSRLPFVGDIGMAEQFDADISAVLLETEARDSKILDASESIMAEAWSDVEPWNDDVDIGPGYIKPASTTVSGPMLTSIFVKRNTGTRPGLSEVPSDEVIVESMSMDTLTVSLAEVPASEPSSTKKEVDVVRNSPESGTVTPGDEADHEEAIQSKERLKENQGDSALTESSKTGDLERTLDASPGASGDVPDAPEDELIVAKEPDPEKEELGAENYEESKSVVSEMTSNTYRLEVKDREDAPDDEVMAIKNEEASGNPLISSALSPSNQRQLDDPLLERSRSVDSKVLSPRREAYNDKAIVSPNKSYDEKRKPDPSGAILSSNYPTRPTTPPPSQPVSPQSQATLDNQAQDAAASGCGACLIL